VGKQNVIYNAENIHKPYRVAPTEDLIKLGCQDIPLFRAAKTAGGDTSSLMVVVERQHI